MKYEIGKFLSESEKYPIVDVRTPAEFAQGHIPGAVNIPLFTNDERAIVGTIYKKKSKDLAVMEGLKIVGPKMYSYVEQAKEIAVSNTVLVHCWRGGMRSGSMAWLFNTAGLQAHTLVGGYKAYRAYIRQSFLRPQKINILGGMTGSNKTDILLEMQKMGQQFIDLEALAHHRGSSYGQIGLEPQPTNEQFENNLAKEWLALDQDKIVWFEDESKGMGRVRIVDELFNRIRKSDLYILRKSKDLRIKHLLNDYADLEKKELELALIRIKKRIGGNNLKIALEALQNNDFRTVVDISLNYYDKAYQYGIDLREDVRKIEIPSEEFDAIKNAELVLSIAINS
jgi:tRNA 2-selenouridine synthase